MTKNVQKTQYGKYRVRVQSNGKRQSRNFSSYKEAINWRNNQNRNRAY